MNKTPMATLALLSLCVAGPLSAQVSGAPVPPTATYLSFLSSADRDALLAQKELTFSGQSLGDLVVARKAPFAAEVAAGMSVSKASVAIEGLFLFPRPRGNVDLALYNAVNAVASMQGLEYFSVSRQRREPLILASWRVSPQNRNQKLPDPVFTTVPAFQKAVVFQKDNKLGEGLSEVTWKSLPQGALVMTFRNLGTLNYGILPLVDPGNLQMLFVVAPLADQVVVYGVMEAKTAQLFGLERSKDESFRNRMRALADWLGQRIAALP
jgi:hypothetical protein